MTIQTAIKSGTGHDLEMVRYFKAPPQAVWDAWTQADQICQWMGPGEVLKCEALEFDVRTGGRFRLRMHLQDGGTATITGIYQTIAAPSLLSFTWQWADDSTPPSHVTVKMREKSGGTEMVLKHINFADAEACARHDYGWGGSFDKMVQMTSIQRKGL